MSDPDVTHIADGGLGSLVRRLTRKVPVALCGFALAGREDGTDPGADAPLCPACADIAWPPGTSRPG